MRLSLLQEPALASIVLATLAAATAPAGAGGVVTAGACEGFGCAVFTTSFGGRLKGNTWTESLEFLTVPWGHVPEPFAAPTLVSRYAADPVDATNILGDGSAACMQPGPPYTPGPGRAYGVEQCLMMDLYLPRASSVSDPAALRPILVWVYGGDNTVDEIMDFNASMLAARHNAVVATVNYRLGPLGFAAFEEDVLAGRSTGNAAMKDLLAAASWLKREAVQLRADPSRVIVFGESSGGTLSQILTMVPAARGIIGGSVSESGGLYAQSLPDALANTRAVGKAVGCTSAEGFKACMQAKPQADIVKHSQDYDWGPAVDRVFLPAAPEVLVHTGGLQNMSVMWGANTNDSATPYMGYVGRKSYISQLNATIHGAADYSYLPRSVKYRRHLERRDHAVRADGVAALSPAEMDDLLEEALALYPPLPGVENNALRVGWFQSDKFLCSARREVAHAGAGGGARAAYMYRFDWFFQSSTTCTADSNYHDPKFGSNHCDEMSFVYGQPIYDAGDSPGDGYTNCSDPASVYYDKTCAGCTFNKAEAELAMDMGTFWTRFALQEKLPGWPTIGPIAASKNIVLRPSSGRYLVEDGAGREEACRFWDTVAGQA